MRKIAIACLTLLLAASLPVLAFAQITSATNGSWTDGGTWVGGVAPTATDDVHIAAADTISVDGAI